MLTRITIVVFVIENLFSIYLLINALKIQIAVIIPFDNKRMFSVDRVMPSIEYSIEKIGNMSLLPRWYEVSVEYANSNCNSKDAPIAAFNFYMKKNVSVFLGPVCDYSLAPVARYAPYWHIPVISPGGFAHDFGDNKSAPEAEYATLTRIGVTFNSLASIVIHMMKYYNWYRLKVIYDGNGRSDITPRFCWLAGASLIHHLNKGRDRSFKSDHDFYLYIPGDHDISKLLREEVGNSYSIVVLCASADSVREIMIKAHELNFDNGEYVFFNIDLFSSKNESERPWHRENDTVERNNKARKAYEALMTVTLRKPTSNEYREFSDEVKRRAKTKYENFTYGEEEVNSFVGAFHDAVILYAIALNETLEANRSISNGTEITRRMWNRTFKGITGNVSIDDNGDRSADYSLLDMNPTTGIFEVVANYFGNSKKYEPLLGKSIHWAGGKDGPPVDTPRCGFDDSKCPPEKPFPEYAIGIIVLGTLLLIVLIASFFIYRHIKLEAELAEMNWRVKWEDIMFGTMEGDRKKRQGSNLSLARTEDGSVEGQTLIARSRSSLSSKDWCKCGQCEEPDHVRRVCCRHIDKLDDRMDGERCITSSKDFQDVVLNKQVLLTVFIHVMLARRQRGVAPHDLTPYKCRLMAARQFLCWVHSGESLKKEIRWSIPTCVTRAIRLMFPDVGAEVTSGDDAGSLSLDEMISIENINHTSV